MEQVVLEIAEGTASSDPDVGLRAVAALRAGAGVVALTRPRPATDYLGIGLGLLAAACWASYILLNREIGRRLPGAEGS